MASAVGKLRHVDLLPHRLEYIDEKNPEQEKNRFEMRPPRTPVINLPGLPRIASLMFQLDGL